MTAYFNQLTCTKKAKKNFHLETAQKLNLLRDNEKFTGHIVENNVQTLLVQYIQCRVNRIYDENAFIMKNC